MVHVPHWAQFICKYDIISMLIHVHGDIHLRALKQVVITLIQPTISLEMPVASQGHYGSHSFPVVDIFCLFIYL